MIRNFSDHAANERTFLAWVRTAIAIIAFGFVVEKFAIFLQTASLAMGGRYSRPGSLRFSEVAGLGLMLMGVALVGVATLRFLKTAKEIDDSNAHLGPGSRFDIALSALLILLGGALVTYLILNLSGAA